MGLQFFNTLYRKKEIFVPAHDNVVRVYSCGPTVYSRQHIGNLRAAVFVDTLKRTLRYHGYEVMDVINITDVGHLVSDEDEGEDKLDKAARQEGKDPYEIARYYENLYRDDLKKLHIIEPRWFPRATEHITEQIEFIEALEAKGLTYVTEDGVYFDTAKFPDYGKLSGQNIADKVSGARVEVRSDKRTPTDFALWKFLSGEHAKHLMRWESPWGVGFPGWHIECSAMGARYLGKMIDIHTGGIEHIPVHHENEIAQNACSGKLNVRFWLHNEHLVFAGGKMAKSQGNVFSLDDLAARGISPLAYRYWLLMSHYRSPQNFTWQAVEAAQHGFSRLIRHVLELPLGGHVHPEYQGQFAERIGNDLDIPQALALVSDILHDDGVSGADKRATITDFDRVFGWGLDHAADLEREVVRLPIPFDELPLEIQLLINEREKARAEKAWHRADEVRHTLSEAGYAIEDRPEGVQVYTADQRPV